MFKKFSDITIIEGVRKQDDIILNWLYDNYFSTVKTHVLKNCGSDDDVSDVFQESIIILYKQICDNSLSLTSDLKGYFFGIARNVWNVQLRRKQKNRELDIDLPEENQDEVHEQLLEKIIFRAFDKLKPDQQEVLKLFSEGSSYEEIAKKMDLKNETYARRKKYLSKEALIDILKEDREYQEYLRFL